MSANIDTTHELQFQPEIVSSQISNLLKTDSDTILLTLARA